MIDFEQLFAKTLNQEQLFILDHFSKTDALNLGMLIHKFAQDRKQSVSLEIEIGRQVVFKFSHPSATPNNDLWVMRKRNMVHIRQMSSLRAFALLNKNKQDMKKDWFLSQKKFVACGGGFPINIKNVGIIGSICVSGVPPMDHYDDHQLIIDSMQKYFNH